MKIEIKKRFTGEILFECDALNMKIAVELARTAKADLTSADLSYADLSSANLRSVDLRSVELTYANLSCADLFHTDLSSANLRYANLSSADLRSANLSCADLTYTTLRSTDLSSANLTYANLRYADLSYADLSYATGSDLVIAMTRILPDGQLIGWKKCRGNVMVKLSIPSDAKRSSAFGRKCRAEFADVLEVIGAKVGESLTTSYTAIRYQTGTRVTPKEPWCETWEEECASGIHFFITRLEAEQFRM